jgi:hypothetical protein
MGGHAARKREINIAENIFIGKVKGKKPHRIVICIPNSPMLWTCEICKLSAVDRRNCSL